MRRHRAVVGALRRERAALHDVPLVGGVAGGVEPLARRGTSRIADCSVSRSFSETFRRSQHRWKASSSPTAPRAAAGRRRHLGGRRPPPAAPSAPPLRRHRLSRQRRAAARVGRRRVELRELAARLVPREGGAPLPVVVVVAVRRVGVRALEAGAAGVAVAAERGARRRERIIDLRRIRTAALAVVAAPVNETERPASDSSSAAGGSSSSKVAFFSPSSAASSLGVGSRRVRPCRDLRPRVAPRRCARATSAARAALAARDGRRLRHRREVAAVPRFAPLARRVDRRVVGPRRAARGAAAPWLAPPLVASARSRDLDLPRRSRERARRGDSWV